MVERKKQKAAAPEVVKDLAEWTSAPTDVVLPVARTFTDTEAEANCNAMIQEMQWGFVRDRIRAWRSNQHMRFEMLVDVVECVIEAVFSDYGETVIPKGESGGLASLFADFMRLHGFVDPANYAFTANDLEEIVFGERGLRTWLEENPENGLKLWKAIRPDQPLPISTNERDAGEPVSAVDLFEKVVRGKNKRTKAKAVVAELETPRKAGAGRLTEDTKRALVNGGLKALCGSDYLDVTPKTLQRRLQRRGFSLSENSITGLIAAIGKGDKDSVKEALKGRRKQNQE